MDEPAGAGTDEADAATSAASADVWPRRAELFAPVLVVVAALLVASGVAQAIAIADRGADIGVRDTLTAAAIQAASPLTVILLAAAIFLAVLDDVLTGQVADRRSPIALATLWSALALAGVFVVGSAYAVYEVVWGPGSEESSRYGSGGRGWQVSFVLYLVSTTVAASFTAWLALRVLGDPLERGDVADDLEPLDRLA